MALMVMMMMMMKYNTNMCHTFVTLVRSTQDDGDADDNDEDAEYLENEYVSHVCDIYSLYKR